MLRAARGTQTSYKRQNAASATRALLLADLARAVLAKSRPVIRQNATSGSLCPEFPRGARALILADLARAVLAKSRPVIRQNTMGRKFMPRISARRARALAVLIGR